MKFTEVEHSFLNGSLIKRKGMKYYLKYEGKKKNKSTNQEFESVVLVDNEGKFKGYAKTSLSDVLANDWEVLNQEKTITEQEFKDMTYKEREEIYLTNPETYEKLNKTFTINKEFTVNDEERNELMKSESISKSNLDSLFDEFTNDLL